MQTHLRWLMQFNVLRTKIAFTNSFLFVFFPTYPRWISSGSAGSESASCRRCSFVSDRRQKRSACPLVQQPGSAEEWRDSPRDAHPEKQPASHMWAGRNTHQCKNLALKLEFCIVTPLRWFSLILAVLLVWHGWKNKPEGCRWYPRRFCWRRPVDKLQSGSVKTF